MKHRAGIAVVLLAAAGKAQVVAVDVDRAVAELAVAERQWDASLALMRAGAAVAVPRLQPLLREHAERPQGAVLMALLVAGRLGHGALPLLADVLEVYRMGGQPDVRRQALWAVGQIAPFANDTVRADVQQALLRHFAPDGDRFLFQCVDERIALGHELAVDDLLGRLDAQAGSDRVTAIGEALAALPRELLTADTSLLPVLRELLDVRLARPPYPWDADTRECEAAPLAAAAWAAGDRSATTARGLLQHWDPELRLAALAALADGAALAPRERWDVVLRLWDPVRAVRDLALATTSAWRDGFAIAVPSLLALAANGTDRAFAAASTRAIDRWLRTTPPATAAAVAVLRGQRPGDVPRPIGDTDLSQLVQLVSGCRGLPNGELTRLAPFVRERALATPDVVGAMLWCVATPHTTPAWRDAVGALVAVGPAVAAARPELAVELVRSGAMTGNYGFAPVAVAWVRAGPAASPAELASAAAGDDWVVAARALAEIVERGVTPTHAMLDAALAARRASYADVVADQGADWGRRRGRGWSYVTKKADPELVAGLATLVLLAAGDARWRDAATLERCAGRFGAEAAPDSLLAAKARGELAQLALRLEQGLRPEWLPPSAGEPASGR
jgi:hypothetical protein